MHSIVEAQRVKHSEGGEELNECAYPLLRGLASLVRGGVRQQGAVSCGVAGSRARAGARYVTRVMSDD